MAKTQRVTSVTFDSTAITSVQSVDVQESALSETTLHTDAADAAQAHFIDGINHTITVTSADPEIGQGWTIGDTGSLVIVYKDRANGRGDAAGTNTSTYANAVLTAKGDGVPHNGQATLTLTFRAVDPSGSLPVAYS
jgi:hypothetical protein